MKIPLKWLAKHIKISDLSTKELSEKYSKQIVDVEETQQFGQEIADVIIGEITKLDKHPNAEKLFVLEVKADKNYTIVTGAPNIAKAQIGQLVPVIPPGGELPGFGVIEEKDLRGITSQGMICSEKELGLGLDHSGVIVLDEYLKDTEVQLDSIKPGQKLIDALGLEDQVFDLDNKIITNRPYCFGIRGLAKELGALLDRDLIEQESVETQVIDKKSDELEIEIQDTEYCSRISGLVLTDLTVKPSPFWMRKALLSVGIRPINNIVDITNYVMYDIGHPMHAFDLDKIAANKQDIKKITGRLAKKGEKLQTLDGKTLELTPEDYIITDTSGPIGLGGIMGGASTEVSQETKNILIVAERFDPISIRKTSRRHKLQSEASTRFEKGLDPNNTIPTLQIAAKLLKEHANAKSENKVVDNYPVKVKPSKLKFDTRKVEKLLGIKIKPEFMKTVLKRFEIKFTEESNDEEVWNLEIPTYRSDVNLEADLVEDIGRMYGYDNLQAIPTVGQILPPVINKELEFEKKAKYALASLGYSEVKTPTFISEKNYKDLDLKEPDPQNKIINPGSKEYTHLRESLLPSHTLVAQSNLKNLDVVNIFETDKIYEASGKKGGTNDRYESGRPKEIKTIGILRASNNPAATETELKKIKGDVLSLCNKLDTGTPEFHLASNRQKTYSQSEFLEVVIQENSVGTIGVLSSNSLKNLGLKNSTVVFAQIRLLDLFNSVSKEKRFKPFSQYPAIKQDFTFDIPAQMRVGEAEQILKSFKSQILASVEIYDIYQDKNKKSISIHVSWQSMTDTLVEKDIAKERDNFIEHADKKGLQVRS